MGFVVLMYFGQTFFEVAPRIEEQANDGMGEHVVRVGFFQPTGICDQKIVRFFSIQKYSELPTCMSGEHRSFYGAVAENVVASSEYWIVHGCAFLINQHGSFLYGLGQESF